jgi:hypothetical protein
MVMAMLLNVSMLANSATAVYGHGAGIAAARSTKAHLGDQGADLAGGHLALRVQELQRVLSSTHLAVQAGLLCQRLLQSILQLFALLSSV